MRLTGRLYLVCGAGYAVSWAAPGNRCGQHPLPTNRPALRCVQNT